MPIRKQASRRSATRALVTFPIHVTGDLWERFKARAREEGRSAHGVLVAFVEKYGTEKPKRK